MDGGFPLFTCRIIIAVLRTVGIILLLPSSAERADSAIKQSNRNMFLVVYMEVNTELPKTICNHKSSVDIKLNKRMSVLLL